MNLPPVILIALEDYERVSALLDVQFPGITYGWSPFVPEGTIYGIDPERMEAELSAPILAPFQPWTTTDTAPFRLMLASMSSVRPSFLNVSAC